MPVHGDHYLVLEAGQVHGLSGRGLSSRTRSRRGRGRWMWDEKRPRYLGEDFYFTGNHPELSTIGGEAALTGKAGTLKACGLMLSMLQQGYRWNGYGAWDFYCGPNDGDDSQWLYMSPRAVFCREWDWTFLAGERVERTLMLFNDTRFNDPIRFEWELNVGGGVIKSR